MISLVAPLAACNYGDRALTGECPADEVCSDATPNGLIFNGAMLSDFGLDSSPHPTLVGGTQGIHLEYSPDKTGARPLDLPYRADDGVGRGVRVDYTSGPVVMLRGVGPHANYLRITDPDGDLYDRKMLEGTSLTQIGFAPPRFEEIAPGEEFVFAPGTVELTVTLLGENENGIARSIDESMALVLPGATRTAWDAIRLPNATVGRYQLTVNAGDWSDTALDIDVVDEADLLVAQDPSAELVADQPAIVCFSAYSAGRYIAGLEWTFEADNGTAGPSRIRNCANVTPDDVGIVNVTASAGGKTITVPLRVTPEGRRGAPEVPQPQGSPAGDRAAVIEAALAAAAQ